MRNLITLTILLISMATYSGFAQSKCSLPIKTPFSAIALYKHDLTGWLENENRMNEICPTQDKACVVKALLARTDKMSVYDHPAGKIIANLEVVYTPGKGMTTNLTQDGKTYPFKPPIYDNDWGYGPYFHATMLDQQGAWKQIVLPSIQSGWVELPEAEILELAQYKESVYTLLGSITPSRPVFVIVKSNNESLTVRDEQPSDMDCAAGGSPPLAPFKEQVIPLSHIYDDNCNLLLVPAYPRGC